MKFIRGPHDIFKYTASLILFISFFVFAFLSIYPLTRNLPEEGQATSPPKVLSQSLPKAKLSAWIPIWGEEEGLKSFEKNKSYLSSISPFWFALSLDGKIEELNSERKAQIINVATSSAIPIIPVLGDELDEARVFKFLSNRKLQEEESEKLVKVLYERRFLGINVSFEHIPQGDQADFVNFLSILADKLHKKDLILAVTVYALRGLPDEPNVHDIAAIGKIADQVRLETYDEHDTETHPGPIASSKFLKEVIIFTQERVPSEKIVVALPTHGFEWWKEGGETLQFPQVEPLIKRFPERFTKDPSSFELVGKYRYQGLEHELWINNSESLKEKIEFLRGLGINQFSLWRLGGEDPNFWDSIP